MPGERVADLPDELESWVRERAEATDMRPEEVLARSVTAYRFLEGESDELAGTDIDGAVTLGADEADLEATAERLADLDDRVGALEADLEEKIDDVRERVIQVKREADGKATADHGHDDLREDLETARRTAADAEEAAEEAQSQVQRIDRGFDNFEDILEYLTETTDELEGRLTRLARLTIDLRETVGELEGQDAARSVTADIKEKANREGVSQAKCGNCDAKVAIGLLTSPQCPDCGRAFSDLQPASGFFGSSTLVVGDRPALTGAETDAPETPDELFDADASEAAAASADGGGAEPVDDGTDAGRDATDGGDGADSGNGDTEEPPAVEDLFDDTDGAGADR
jgi:archaellum component FlaC